MEIDTTVNSHSFSFSPMSDSNSLSKALNVTKLKILRLFEFYFSDGEIKSLLANKAFKDLKDTNGWIPISKIASFQRVKALSQNINVIVGALKESQILELSPDFASVRRKDMPEDLINGLLDFKGIFVKDLPVAVNENEVKSYFSQFGSVSEVKYADNGVIVEFATEAEADNVVSLKHFYNGEQFSVEYKKRSHSERAKESRKDSRKRKHGKDQSAGNRYSNAEETVTFGYDSNRIVKVWRIPKGTTRDTLRAIFSKYGPLQSIDYHPPADYAYLRYSDSIAGDVVNTIAKEGGIFLSSDNNSTCSRAASSPPASIPPSTFSQFTQSLQQSFSSSLELKAMEGDEEHLYYQALYGKASKRDSARNNTNHQNEKTRHKKNKQKGKGKQKGRKGRKGVPVLTQPTLGDELKKRYLDSDDEDEVQNHRLLKDEDDSDVEVDSYRRKKAKISQSNDNDTEEVSALFVGLKA